MNCESIEILLSAYIDGELTKEEKEECEQHLQTCEQCKGLLELLIQMQQSIDVIEYPELPECFHRDLMEQISKEQATPEVRKTRHSYKWIGYLGTLAAVCIAGMVMINPKEVVQPPISVVETNQSEQNSRNRSMPTPMGIMEQEQVTDWIITVVDEQNLMDALSTWSKERHILFSEIQVDTAWMIELSGTIDYQELVDFVSTLEGIEQLEQNNQEVDERLVIKLIKQ